MKSSPSYYIDKSPHKWDVPHLGMHFVGFLKELQEYLSKRYFQHYWLPHVYLLKDINPMTIDDMANRLKRILSREAVLNRILCCTTQEAHGRVQSERHCISLQDDNVTQNQVVLPVRMPQAEDRTQIERYRSPRFPIRQKYDVQNEYIPFLGLSQIEDRTQIDRYRGLRFPMRQREQVRQYEHIPLVRR